MKESAGDAMSTAKGLMGVASPETQSEHQVPDTHDLMQDVRKEMAHYKEASKEKGGHTVGNATEAAQEAFGEVGGVVV